MRFIEIEGTSGGKHTIDTNKIAVVSELRGGLFSGTVGIYVDGREDPIWTELDYEKLLKLIGWKE